MARPKEKTYNLKEKLEKIIQAGFTPIEENLVKTDELAPLSERIKSLLHILKDKPQKATTMTFLIMYDIENNKVRTRVSKYLEKQGCIRIQKSIFLTNTESKNFNQIYDTLLEVQSYYENKDSILLVPFNTSDLRSMKIIGKEIHISTLLDKPNTLFF